MHIRKILFSYILVLLFTSVYSSNTLDFKVNFAECQKTKINTFQSEIFKTEFLQNYDFAGISAFFLTEKYSEVNLFYRLFEDQKWSEWIRIPQDNDGYTPGRIVFSGDFIYSRFEEIQFASDINIQGEITFRIFYSQSKVGEIKKNTGSVNSLFCKCPAPEFCNRDCWGQNSPADSTPTFTQPTHIIIHHSAGNTVSNNYASVVAYYWDLHVNTKGWDDIGYNWLIDPNGIIYEGRGTGVLGAHFSCTNSNTTGICLIGNFQENQVSEKAVNSLVKLVAWECCDKGINPVEKSYHKASMLDLYNISGHLDGNFSPASSSCASGTECPGVYLYKMLQDIRDSVFNTDCIASQVKMHTNNDIRIFPIPVYETLFIELPENISTDIFAVKVYNSISGQIISRKINKTGEFLAVNVGNNSPGIYYLEISGGDFYYSGLFIKE